MTRGFTFVVGLYALSAAVGTPTDGLWARQATRFEMICNENPARSARVSHGTAEASLACRNASPEDTQIRVTYRAPGMNATADLLGDDDQWRPEELLWSPDGRAFAISGSDNAYAGFDFMVFRVEGGRLVRSHPVIPARRAMIDRLAECWPEVRTAGEYRSPELDAINLSAVAWKDASTLAVFAEVVPSSAYGSALGQVMGFEIDVRHGVVRRAMAVEEFKQRWQFAAAWNIRLPEKADCGQLFASGELPTG